MFLVSAAVPVCGRNHFRQGDRASCEEAPRVRTRSASTLGYNTPVALAITRWPTFFTSFVVGCASDSSLPVLRACCFSCAAHRDMRLGAQSVGSKSEPGVSAHAKGKLCVQDLLEVGLAQRLLHVGGNEDVVNAVCVWYFLPAAIPENSDPANHHHGDDSGTLRIWGLLKSYVRRALALEVHILPAKSTVNLAARLITYRCMQLMSSKHPALLTSPVHLESLK